MSCVMKSYINELFLRNKEHIEGQEGSGRSRR